MVDLFQRKVDLLEKSALINPFFLEVLQKTKKSSMQDIEIKSWLFDILQSIAEIESYFDENYTFEMYVNDTKTKRAVERDLEIIGEAVKRIIKKEPEFPISDTYQIIGTSNRIIHGYDLISNDLIWSILEMNIPKLKKEVTNIIGT